MTTNSDQTCPAASATPSREQTSFRHLLNVGALPTNRPFSLLNDLVLRKANSAEVERVQSHLQSLSGFSPLSPRLVYEYTHDRESGAFSPLPASEYCYYGFYAPGTGTMGHSVEAACFAHPKRILTGSIFLSLDGNNGGVGHHAGESFQFFHLSEGTASEKLLELDATDIETLAGLLECLHGFDHSLLDLRPVFSSLLGLRSVPSHSPLIFLGYFSALEALLSHQPKPGDPYDSISRQVRQKMALLHPRMSPALSYGSFGGADPSTVWKRLYAYRSCIAHGAQANFESGNLQVLGSPENCRSFLDQATRSVLRQALKEPELLRDLKNC